MKTNNKQSSQKMCIGQSSNRLQSDFLSYEIMLFCCIISYHCLYYV